ncbi:MAG: ParB/RepB/Spo0J family partition protein [Brevinema sp.]
MKIKDIIVSNRIRRNLGDLEPLMESFKKYGQLSPIVVNKKNELLAGERRLEAAKKLGWTDIEAIIKDLSYSQEIELEMEENTTRKDFEITELTEGYRRHLESLDKNIFHRIYFFFRDLWKRIFHKK